MTEHEPRETEILLPPTLPFYFDPERMVFVFGFEGSEEILAPERMNDIWDLSGKKPYDPVETDLNTSETLVSTIYGPLIAMPSARKALAELKKDPIKTKAVGEEVLRVIRDVFHAADPKIPIPRSRKQDYYPTTMAVILSKDATFKVRTLGNCACLGPSATPMSIDLPIGSRISEDMLLPLELELHNVTSRAQRLSLFAGAGTIGWMTKRINQGLVK